MTTHVGTHVGDQIRVCYDAKPGIGVPAYLGPPRTVIAIRGETVIYKRGSWPFTARKWVVYRGGCIRGGPLGGPL